MTAAWPRLSTQPVNPCQTDWLIAVCPRVGAGRSPHRLNATKSRLSTTVTAAQSSDWIDT
jgi:hypothetical protein